MVDDNFISFYCLRYSECWGDIGVCDQLLQTYRAFFRTCKWTVKVTLHVIGLVSVNYCLKYREGCQRNQVKQENFGFTCISGGHGRYAGYIFKG
jgi:hypothetical protein